MVMISTIEHERDDTKRDCDDHANDACTTTNNVLCVLGVVIQGESEAELPERVLACITLNKIDIDATMKLEEDE